MIMTILKWGFWLVINLHLIHSLWCALKLHLWDYKTLQTSMVLSVKHTELSGKAIEYFQSKRKTFVYITYIF